MYGAYTKDFDKPCATCGETKVYKNDRGNCLHCELELARAENARRQAEATEAAERRDGKP